MASLTGARLGAYDILALIGSGGMGEVYRARDPRLGRDVAVKVLPALFSTDPDRRRRFELEARAAAALSHPNILQILDVGSDGTTAFVVSELLEGDTLRGLIEHGALPISRVVEYARQLALGLAAAHAKGITHRDVKPENVFVTADGVVKILDFGLAKVREAAASDGATELHQTTGAGVVLGTVGYMSPEQVRAQSVDARSDIFSAGVVIFEMAAGSRPFHGASSVETMHAILRDDPPELSARNVRVPPGLQRIVHHCLEKSPADRFQSARDLAFAFEALSGSDPGSASAPAGSARRSTINRAWWIGAAVAGALLLAALPFAPAALRRAPAAAPLVKFAVGVPEKSYFPTDYNMHNVSVSPDGKTIVFVAILEGRRSLWVRSLDELDAHPLADTDGASSPFWSPDSRAIAYFAGGMLRRIDRSGTSRQPLCTASAGVDTAGTWGSAGTILYTDKLGDKRVILRVPETGGIASAIAHKTTHPYWVYFLPDGRHYLFHERAFKRDDPGIYAAALDEPGERLLAPDIDSRVEFAQGQLLFAREGSLIARPFDAATRRFTGEPKTIVDHLPYFDQTGWSEFSASTTGVLVYVADVPKNRMVWLDRGGRPVGQVGTPGLYDGVRLSRDGLKLAYTMPDTQLGSGDVWIHDLARNTSTRFASGPADDGTPVWAPDGRSLAFFSCCIDKPWTEQTTMRIKRVGDSGPGEVRAARGFDQPSDWSEDHHLLFSRNIPATTRQQLWILSTGDGTERPFMTTPFSETRGRFSPDGRWLAFISDETSRPELYVARVDPAGEDRQMLSVAGAFGAVWRRDGKELFFLSPDGSIMSVAVTPGATLQFGQPVALFANQLLVSDSFDVTPDGQRFLVIVGSPQTLSMPFAVILNWARQ